MQTETGTGKKRPLAELKDKAFQALVHPDAVWVVRNSSTPTAAHDMARNEFRDADLAKACRFAAMIRRDYGDEAFETAVWQENAPGGDLNLTHEEGVRAFGCLCEAHKRLVWAEFLKLALAPQIIAFLRVVYEDLEQEDYERWELRPFEQEALALVKDPERKACNQDLINFIAVGMIPDGAFVPDFDVEIALLRERRPAIDQCVAAIIERNPFANAAWELIQEYDIAAEDLRQILGQIADGRHTYDEIKDEALAMLEQLG